MGSHVTSNSWVTTGSAYAHSEQTNFPATNVYPEVIYPSRPWKSLSAMTAGTTYIALNPGATADYSGYALVIDDINVASITVLISDTYGLAGSAVSANVTVGRDLADGRYKLWYPLATLAGLHSGTQQHIGVRANTGTTTDGGTVMQVGTLGLVSSYSTWTTNVGFPFEWEPLQAQQVDEMQGGGVAVTTLGRRSVQIVLNQSIFPNAMKTTLQTMLGYGADPFLWYRGYDSASTHEVYIVRRLASVRLAQAGPSHLSLSTTVLREVV